MTVSRNERRHLMKSLIFSIAFIGLALTASAQSTIALPAWKSVKSTDCEQTDGGKTFRCVIGGATTLIKVAPSNTKKPFAFTYTEWHSTCGFPGGKMHEE